MGRFGQVAFIPLLFLMCVLGLASLALAQEGPTVNITGPEDLAWFTDPGIVVHGGVVPESHEVYMNLSALGTSDHKGLAMQDDLAVLRSRQHFSDGFDGTTLDMEKWEIINNLGQIGINDGNLVIWTWYAGNQAHCGLVRTVDGSLPSDDGSDWEAEFRMKYVYALGQELGGGIGSSTTDHLSSHVAAYLPPGQNTDITAFAKGDLAYRNSTATLAWHVYRLQYDSLCRSYRFYVDGVEVARFKHGKDCDLIWFGSDEPYMPWGQPQGWLQVDHVQVWTLSGLWTSEVHDMGYPAVFDRIDASFNTTRPAKAVLEPQLRVSVDNRTWSEWITAPDGFPAETAMGRYVQYRCKLALPGVYSTKGNIRLDGITVGYHYPLVSLAYEHNEDGWVAMDPGPTWNVSLNLTEDDNTFVVRAIDTKNLVHAVAHTFILDTTPPDGSISINGGAAWAKDNNLTLDLQAFDEWGVAWVELTNDPYMTMWTRRPYCETHGWWVPDIQGRTLVLARFIDSHGLVSPVATDMIMLDTIEPTARLTVEGGKGYTPTPSVSLQLEYSDNNAIDTVRLSNRADQADAVEVEPGTKETEWDLGVTEDSQVTVHLLVTDLAGNVAVATDSIHVSFPKEVGKVEIEGGEPVVGMTVVTLTITTPEGYVARLMQLSNSGDFGSAEWTEFSESTLWFLSEGDGERTVSVRFEDQNGIVSLPINDTVLLDASPPRLTVRLEDGARYTTRSQVRVTLTYEDMNLAGRMWVALFGDLEGAEPVRYSSRFTFDLPEREGTYIVQVQVEDRVGNAAQAAATIHLATLSPVISLHLPGGSTTNARDTVPVEVRWSDAYGDIEVQMAFDGDPVDADPWMPLEGLHRVPIPPGTPDGDYQIRARARNAPGLVSDTDAVDLTLDRTDPTLTIAEPVNGSSLVPTGMNVEVRLDHGDGTGIAGMSYRIDGGEWLPLDHRLDPLLLEFPAYGVHRLDVRAVDEAGNQATDSVEVELERRDEGGISGFGGLVALVALLLLVALLRPTGPTRP